METLNIEEFSPKKAELIQLAEESKSLVINGIDDKQGYLAVHQQRMKLKNSRVEITKTGKRLRESAVAFQKEVIAREKELIGIIEPLEIELENKQKAVDDEKERLKRIKLIPERRAKLKEIEVEIDDEFLTLLDDAKFQEYYNRENEIYLFNKAEKIRLDQEERQRQIDKDREELEAEKRRVDEEKRINEARIKAVEDAQKKAEQDKIDAVEAERQRGINERQRLIDEQARKERERIEAEERAAEEAKEKEARELEKQELIEKKRKYKKFLKDNDAIGAEFIFIDSPVNGEPIVYRVGDSLFLYKKIGEIII